MGKGQRLKEERRLQKEQEKIDNEVYRQDRKEQKMIANNITVFISVLALIVSIVSVGITLIYSKADYEYKRDPVITAGGSIEIKNMGEYTVPKIGAIEVNIKEENNLENVYMVNPDYKVTQIMGDNYTKAIENYFNEEYENDETSLFLNGYKYFYQYIVFTSIDDTMEINLFYCKTPEVGYNSEKASVEFKKVDEVNLIELEKGHSDDPAYEGERIMAKQFREIAEYYNDML